MIGAEILSGSCRAAAKARIGVVVGGCGLAPWPELAWRFEGAMLDAEQWRDA